MLKTIQTSLWVGVLAAVSAGAAVYRFELGGGGMGMSGWHWVPQVVDSSLRVPVEPSAPPGYEISYPEPEGTDSLTWRDRRGGLAVRSCLSCSDRVLSWLPMALASTPQIPSEAQWVDTQHVTVDGVSRRYIRASQKHVGTFGKSTMTAFLEGIGQIYRNEKENPGSSMSHWYAYFRLLEYNGLNIDTLWGRELPQPTAIAPSAHRRPATRLGARRFDLHEMGIFLGRKSALREPLPRTR